ncbi:MAG: GNAT family N-acetyltransferase [Armatimonadetes bacterium]|nr:GNAT family N-acetyltransferase [Armatimonadota bacterium]
MSGISVRPITDADETFWRVRSLTYNNAKPIEAEQRADLTWNGYVAEKGSETVGIYALLPFETTRGESTLKAAGIAGVAVDPVLRRGGNGTQMMQAAVQDLYASGHDLASLAAFRETFYRRVGFATCGMRYKITCPSNRLPKLNAELPVHRLETHDPAVLQPCLDSFARARSGVNLRDEVLWRRRLNPNQTIYVAGDPVEAYALVQHDWQFWNVQSVDEFVWSSMRGYQSILSFFEQLGVNKSAMEWCEPGDSPFYSQFLDQGPKIEVDRPFMYRVIDFRQALSKLSPRGKGSFVLELLDPDIPQNQGTWRISWADGKVTTEACIDVPDLVAPITAWTQAFLGDPSLDRLVRLGAVEVRGDRWQEATQLLSPRPVVMMDFF